MEITEEHKLFLKTFLEMIEKEANKVDPYDKSEEKHVTLSFTVKNAPMQPSIKCPTGCIKLANGRCLCHKPVFQ